MRLVKKLGLKLRALGIEMDHGKTHGFCGYIPKIGVPQNGWFIRKTPIKMDDLGVPLFLETPLWGWHKISWVAFQMTFKRNKVVVQFAEAVLRCEHLGGG